MNRRFTQVDVFAAPATATAPALALRGNPLAVVHAAQGLDDAQMQAFARWTNLSETSFLLPPTDPAADYRVRIFTPQRELAFAGHPTLGSCHAWLEAGGAGRAAGEVVQQCAAGLIRIRRDAGRLAFAAPPCRRTGPLDAELLARIGAALALPSNDIVDHSGSTTARAGAPSASPRPARCWPCARTGRRCAASSSVWSARIRPQARCSSRCAR